MLRVEAVVELFQGWQECFLWSEIGCPDVNSSNIYNSWIAQITRMIRLSGWCLQHKPLLTKVHPVAIGSQQLARPAISTARNLHGPQSPRPAISKASHTQGQPHTRPAISAARCPSVRCHLSVEVRGNLRFLRLPHCVSRSSASTHHCSRISAKRSASSGCQDECDAGAPI